MDPKQIYSIDYQVLCFEKLSTDFEDVFVLTGDSDDLTGDSDDLTGDSDERKFIED